MARFALALFFLSACTAVVSDSAPDNADPTAVLAGPWEEPVDAGEWVDAGPMGLLSGSVGLPGDQPASGATVTLAPGGLQTTTDPSGDYVFPAVPAGPFTLTATLAGYRPGTLSGALADGQALAVAEIDLQASVALFAPDGGFSATWLAFSPDGGQLYAADEGSMWHVALDGGAVPLTTGEPALQPLGFDSAGTPIYFANLQTFDGGLASGDLQLGPGIGVPLAFAAPGPYLVGDEVYFAGPAGKPGFAPAQVWSVVSAARPVPALAVREAFASPAPVPTTFGLVGYSLSDVPWDPTCSQSFEAAPTYRELLGPVCAPVFPLPAAVGVSADGALAALVFSNEESVSITLSDTWQVSVLAGDRAQSLSQHTSGAQLAALTAIVPLSPASAAEVLDDGSILLDTPGGSTTIQGTRVAALPDGSALYLNGANLQHGSSAPLPFAGLWSQPVVSPDGAHVVFPGVPMVVDVPAWKSLPLAETPQAVQFSPDGSKLLIVAEDRTLHVATFPAVGMQESPLEGSATLALLTPDGQSVVYAGSDPAGAVGIFEQPAAAP